MIKATEVQTWRMFEGTKWPDMSECLKATVTAVRECSVLECKLPYGRVGTAEGF